MKTQVPNVFTLHIQELREDSNIYSVQVRWFTKIKDVKDLLHSITRIAPSRQQLFQSNCSVPLSSSLTMHDLKISKSGHSLRLSISDGSVLGVADFVLNRAGDASLDDACSRILTEVRLGLQRHHVPVKTDVLDCTGGVYFMRAASGRKVAVFKPQDEEQGMPNNTKGYEGSGESGLRQYYKPGHGCMREVAAYLMDVKNYCSVPPTSLVHFQHPILNYPLRGGRTGHPFPKFGSLQKFVNAFDSFEDIGISVLSDLEVQKIALLDLRLLNSDRNASNILAIHKDSYGEGSASNAKGSKYSSEEVFDLCFDESIPTKSEGSGGDSYALVPIDHGYCLPSKLLINEIDWSWFYYPQVKRPVHPDIKKYIEELDLESTLKNVLSHVSLSDDSLFLARISHKLVVEGVKAGLTLYEIATIVARVNEENPSTLEIAIEEAEENAHRTIEMRLGTISRSGKFRGNEKDRNFWKSPEKPTSMETSKSMKKRTSENENTKILHCTEKFIAPVSSNWHPGSGSGFSSGSGSTYGISDSSKTDSSSSSLEDETNSILNSAELSHGSLSGGDSMGVLNRAFQDRNFDLGVRLDSDGDDGISPYKMTTISERNHLEATSVSEDDNDSVNTENAPRSVKLSSTGVDSGPSIPSTQEALPISTIAPSTTSITPSTAAPSLFIGDIETPSSTLESVPNNISESACGDVVETVSDGSSARTPHSLPSSLPQSLPSSLSLSLPLHHSHSTVVTPSVSVTATSGSSSSSTPSTASTTSTGGPPKTTPYSRALHGQPLHAVQSEDGSMQYAQSLSQAQGGGLRRMNALNPFADIYPPSLSSPVAHSLHPPSSSVSTVSSAPHGHSPPLPLSPAAAVISRRRVLTKDRDRDVNDVDNDNGSGSNYDTTDSDAPDEPLERGLFEGEGDRDRDVDNDDTPVLIQLPKLISGVESAKDPGSDSESTYRTPERMLASAFKKLALSPPRRPYQQQQSGSALQIKTPKDGETDGYYANDDDDLGGTDSDDSPGSSPLAVSAMIRVTSFSAFGSAPIYDAEDAERRVGKLRKERRRQVALTDEFGRLRLLFARNSIATLISKALKRRNIGV